MNWLSALKRLLLGQPIESEREAHEKLSRPAALAVFSSDALSSVAYATEEILLAFLAIGYMAFGMSIWIAGFICVLMWIVGFSYRQTIHAYPRGGGSYIVAKENLGVLPGLIAAASLLIDYVLTVAVSTAAGVAAVVSAFPQLASHRVLLCLAGVWVIATGNLRGLKESARIFMGPAYLFIFAIFLLVGGGLLGFGQPHAAHAETGKVFEGIILLAWLRAFASGCAALTGIEAISDGIPAFRAPASVNAAATLMVMLAILSGMFIGITAFSHQYNILPDEGGGETVLSQLGRAVFGGGPLYYYLQFSTALILFLAANTAYADFPRLSSFLARDGFAPRQLANLGDRLVFSNGIVALSILASLLLIVYGGDTHALIPLYAVGVFASFTLSQAGMVMHWARGNDARRVHSIVINSIGCLTTGVVLLVILWTKLPQGAWVVLLLIPIFITMFAVVHQHYRNTALQLRLRDIDYPRDVDTCVVVPIGAVHRPVIRAVSYAKGISKDVRGILIDNGGVSTGAIEKQWRERMGGLPLVVLESPYRSLITPLAEYVSKVRREEGKDFVTVVIPEFVPASFWQHLLHNQNALVLKGRFLFERGVVVTSVPFHLE